MYILLLSKKQRILTYHSIVGLLPLHFSLDGSYLPVDLCWNVIIILGQIRIIEVVVLFLKDWAAQLHTSCRVWSSIAGQVISFSWCVHHPVLIVVMFVYCTFADFDRWVRWRTQTVLETIGVDDRMLLRNRLWRLIEDLLDWLLVVHCFYDTTIRVTWHNNRLHWTAIWFQLTFLIFLVIYQFFFYVGI